MSDSVGNLRSPLKRARGLGSAKFGTEHWWSMRVTSAALVLLSIWFVGGVIGHLGADHAAFVAWLKSPMCATMMALTAAVTFHHAEHGLQVVIEDYVHCEAMKVAALLANKLICYGLAAACVISVVKVSLGA
jgi:succinate dehydrogenase / fumarate reductase, membrane anchor subunit